MGGRVLVTGAGGFVGRHLTAALGDRATPSSVDVTDPSAIRAALREARPQAVVHLAARSSVAGSWDDSSDVWRVNAVGTVNVLAAVRAEAPEARTLVVSTGEVYGRAEEIPTPEESRLAPVSPYAASKAAAEIASQQARDAYGLDVVVARPFPHAGPGQDERFAIGSWTLQIARLEAAGGGSLRVGNLTAERDITDVRDVCRAYELLLERSVPARTYNIASGRAVTMRRIVELLVGIARCPIDVELDPARMRPADIPVLAGDPSRLALATAWRPEIPLETTLAEALEEARRTVTGEEAAKT